VRRSCCWTLVEAHVFAERSKRLAADGTPDKAAELVAILDRCVAAVCGSGAVDAQNTPTAPWKTHMRRIGPRPSLQRHEMGILAAGPWITTVDNGTDRDLVRRMLAGEEPAFDEFFADYFPRLFRLHVRHTSRHVATATPRGRATTQPAFEGFAERRH
jgi:hypothetical protein